MRFAHTNIVARDWRALADFYIAVLGCTERPPKRVLAGQWLADGTGVPDAEFEGMHLLLPGHGDAGPTLEIFTYAETTPHASGAANRQGLGHVAFEVDDVAATLPKLLEAGGTLEGTVVSRHIAGEGTITFVYARDPEGNIVELQSWVRDAR